MPRVETAGHKKYWEMRQFIGRGADNTRRCVEGFRNMQTGDFHFDEDGFNGEPPPLLPGERTPETASEKFKTNYKETFGHD